MSTATLPVKDDRWWDAPRIASYAVSLDLPGEETVPFAGLGDLAGLHDPVPAVTMATMPIGSVTIMTTAAGVTFGDEVRPRESAVDENGLSYLPLPPRTVSWLSVEYRLVDRKKPMPYPMSDEEFRELLDTEG